MVSASFIKRVKFITKLLKVSNKWITEMWNSFYLEGITLNWNSWLSELYL